MRNLPIVLLLLVTAQAASATTPLCRCIGLFTAKLDQLETEDGTDISDQNLEAFQALKAENSQFKRCSEYFNLKMNAFSAGKLKMVGEDSDCAISQKTLYRISEGPLFYDMDINLEKALQEAKAEEVWVEEDNPDLEVEVTSRAWSMMDALYTGDMDAYFEFLPETYIDLQVREVLRDKVERTPDEMERSNISIPSLQFSLHIPFYRNGDVIQTILHLDATVVFDGDTAIHPVQIFAISLNGGEHWYFMDLIENDLMALAALVDEMNPFVLQTALSMKLLAENPAETHEELGDHFCECNDHLEEYDLEGLFRCMEILTLNPLFQTNDDIRAVHDYVKEHCAAHAGNIVFDIGEEE